MKKICFSKIINCTDKIINWLFMCPKQSERLEDIQKKYPNASKEGGNSEVNEQIVSFNN